LNSNGVAARRTTITLSMRIPKLPSVRERERSNTPQTYMLRDKHRKLPVTDADELIDQLTRESNEATTLTIKNKKRSKNNVDITFIIAWLI
jgi:hypothetical protein